MPGSQVEVNDIKNSFERGESEADGIKVPLLHHNGLTQYLQMGLGTFPSH